jgi:hypothetical protein
VCRICRARDAACLVSYVASKPFVLVHAQDSCPGLSKCVDGLRANALAGTEYHEASTIESQER